MVKTQWRLRVRRPAVRLPTLRALPKEPVATQRQRNHQRGRECRRQSNGWRGCRAWDDSGWRPSSGAGQTAIVGGVTENIAGDDGMSPPGGMAIQAGGEMVGGQPIGGSNAAGAMGGTGGAVVDLRGWRGRRGPAGGQPGVPPVGGEAVVPPVGGGGQVVLLPVESQEFRQLEKP